VLHEKRPIVVIAEGADDLPVTDRRAYRDVWHVAGSPTDSAALKAADVGSAYAAIVLPDSPDDASADAGSILKTLAVKYENPKLYTCAQVLDTENRVHFEDAPVDEIVATGEVGAKLLAQAVLTPGITNIYRRLVSATEDTNEVYRCEVRGAVERVAVGKTFAELRGMLDGDQVLLVGLETRREDGSYVMTVNPKREDRLTDEDRRAGRVSRDGYRIGAADRLLVVSYGPADLRNALLRR